MRSNQRQPRRKFIQNRKKNKKNEEKKSDEETFPIMKMIQNSIRCGVCNKFRKTGKEEITWLHVLFGSYVLTLWKSGTGTNSIRII